MNPIRERGTIRRSMPKSRELEIVVAEMRTIQKIEMAALMTAETVRQATGQHEFTPEEVKAIAEDKRPSGFNISISSTTVTVTKS